jgi:hypothetical protein
MSTQHWPISNNREERAKNCPSATVSTKYLPSTSPAVFVSSSNLSSSYHTENTFRLYYKSQIVYDVYETARSYWDNISVHKNILGGKMRIHFMF